MKTMAWGMVIAFALVGLQGLGAAEPEPAAVGKVTDLKGTVEVKTGDKVTPATVGTPISIDSAISTKKKSRVEIVLADNSVVRLGSNSDLTIDKGMFGKVERQFSGKLVGGKAYAVVTKQASVKSSFEVRTGNAVAGVRGTAFRISKDERSTVVRVYTGAVAVSNAPLYQKPGKTQPASGKTATPTTGPKSVKPGGPGRVEVAGPKEVTKKQWEEFVAKALQEVTIAADGTMTEPVAFDPQKEAQLADEDEREWVAWNKSRDASLRQ